MNHEALYKGLKFSSYYCESCGVHVVQKDVHTSPHIQAFFGRERPEYTVGRTIGIDLDRAEPQDGLVNLIVSSTNSGNGLLVSLGKTHYASQGLNEHRIYAVGKYMHLRHILDTFPDDPTRLDVFSRLAFGWDKGNLFEEMIRLDIYIKEESDEPDQYIVPQNIRKKEISPDYEKLKLLRKKGYCPF